MQKIALIGIGNIMFCDEGLGAYVTRYIEKNYEIPKNVTIVEGGTLGFGLMTYYQEYDTIVVVGTGSHEGPAGTIATESAQDVIAKSPIRKTANEVEITMMIEICSFHEAMGEVKLITMVPEDIVSVKNALTNTILKAMPKLVDRVVEEFESLGIALRRKDSVCSFEEIIEAFANPKQTFEYEC